MRATGILGVLSWLFLVTGEVIMVTDQNKADVFSSSRHSLIYFTKPNCKYCVEFTPVFEQLSQLYDNDEEFQLVKVDSSKHPDLKQKFAINSYPKLVLYDPKSEQAKYFKDKRNLIQVINFINENTNAINNELESNVKNVQDIADLKLQNDLVIFALSYLPTFEGFEFPDHFFQQLSYEYNYNFNVIFVDKVDASELLKKYRVTNYPSAIYFKTLETVKIYKTLSVYHEHKNKLGQGSVIEFVNHMDLNEEKYGQWFERIDDLNHHVDNLTYEFIDQVKFGFNVRQHADEQVDDDAYYEQLLQQLNI